MTSAILLCKHPGAEVTGGRRIRNTELPDGTLHVKQSMFRDKSVLAGNGSDLSRIGASV
jgi:hypothetical protein